MADHLKGLDGLTPEDVAPPYPEQQYQPEVPPPRVPPMQVRTGYAKCKRPAHKASRDRKRKMKYEAVRHQQVEADIRHIEIPLGRDGLDRVRGVDQARDAVPSHSAVPKATAATTAWAHRVAPWMAAGYRYVAAGDG